MTATEPQPGGWLVDVNVLVALTLNTHVHHARAHAALRRHHDTWATCPLTESALIRLLLNPRVTGRAFPAALVLQIVSGLRGDPRWRWLPDESSLLRPLIDTSVLVGHQQVTDLHLVNLAAGAGLRLVTFDAGIAAGLSPDDRRHLLLLPQ